MLLSTRRPLFDFIEYQAPSRLMKPKGSGACASAMERKRTMGGTEPYASTNRFFSLSSAP
jgi:hypothetical protein